MVRSTTNGTLKTYRYNLQRSTYKQNQALNTVLTQRTFNTFAEDPAAAAKSFQLRRSFERTNSQYDLGSSVVKKYDVAWSTLQSVIDDVNNSKGDSAFSTILAGASDTSGAGSVALGQSLTALAKGIVQSMNCRYGDNFVFAGADGLNVPFSLSDDGTLTYRGIPVDNPVVVSNYDGSGAITVNDQGEIDATGTNYILSDNVNLVKVDEARASDKANALTAAGSTTPEEVTIDGTNYYVVPQSERYTIPTANCDATKLQYGKTLEYMSGETKYADLGLGLQENENGEIINSSAANIALQGINFLGYGVDEDGDPKNIVSIIYRMGQILERCDESSGAWASSEDRTEYYRLAGKFEDAAAELSNKHTSLDTEASFYQSNQKQLESQAYTLEEQFLGIEDVELGEAITAFSWAQYCYNAALKVGNSVLSQSLMDYITT
jgi:flagellar hook-associated protein 3 FlgL